MRVALLTPYAAPSVRGNAITVQRIAQGLRERGLSVLVAGLDRRPPADVLQAVRSFRPDVVHGFHARRAGPLALHAAGQLAAPAVITLTGTDVNEDLEDPARRPAVLEVLGQADALIAFHATIRDRVLGALPVLAPRTHVIPQAAFCHGPHVDLAALSLAPDAFLVVQAAGIRRVKAIPSVLPPLAVVHARHPRLCYVLAGPIIETGEHARVQALLADRAWARYLGPRPHLEVCALLGRAQASISSSTSEGGMPNAVLEAMSHGVPVLASDIEGHRSVIEDGVDGLLYRSAAEFEERLERLMHEPAWAATLGARARAKAARDFAREREIEAHCGLYRSLVAARV